jgi:hypothetical protein
MIDQEKKPFSYNGRQNNISQGAIHERDRIHPGAGNS